MNNRCGFRRLQATAVTAGGMAVQAATLGTWTFSQSGFFNDTVISGSLCGLLEPSSLIEPADLTQLS